MIASPTRPVLRYHGGKWRLAPWIIKHLAPHRIYTEAFGGGASVLIRKPRSCSEVYNDLDGEIVSLFRALRDPEIAARLERALRFTPFARDEFLQAYEDVADPVEQSRRTLVKSFMGFGSGSVHDPRPRGMRTRASTWKAPTGFRANATRSGAAPATDWARYPDQLQHFVERLRGVVIENRNAVEVIQQHDRADCLHYVDPPYPFSTRSSIRGSWEEQRIYRYEMTDDAHRELARVLHGVEGMVVISGYRCELYDVELYPDWRRVERTALADGARKRTEVLWLNPAAAAHQNGELFG
ncbi:MAG: DNA adenine methylase [Gemmatimonadota bacterium]|nr:DNA adenine methylase [Gemmatimonadota bacterium]